MKITKERTNYLLVSAEDSRCSGTDYAVIKVNRVLTNQMEAALKGIEAAGGGRMQMMDFSCNYLEVEKLNESLFHEMEAMKQGDDWEYEYIHEELYRRLMESSAIETCCNGTLNVQASKFEFELYDEAGTDGYYLVFRTDELPVDVILRHND